MLTTTFGFPVSMVLVDVFVSRERETDRQTDRACYFKKKSFVLMKLASTVLNFELICTVHIKLLGNKCIN